MMSGLVTAGRDGNSIEWRPRWVRWLLPLCVYGLAVWGSCELAQRSTWGLVWLALVGCAAYVDARQTLRERGAHRTLRLSDGCIEVDGVGVDAISGPIERAWLGPFATAVWLHTATARRLLVVYRVEMSSAGYAALRRHLKLWAPRAPSGS